MRSRLCLALPLLAALAVPAHSAPRETILTCTAAFARNASHDGVVKAFGAENVISRKLGVGEGEEQRGTVVFPRDKTRRLEIIWRNEKTRHGLAEIRTVPGSVWRTAQGVTLKMTLEQVQKINGRPFTISGFGWDYGGTTSSWKDGALDKQPGGCHLRLHFSQQKETKADIDGDRDFSSDNAGMRSAEPVVEQISLLFRD